MNITQLPYPKIGAPWKKVILFENLHIEQWSIPKGSIVFTKQSQDFGFLLIPEKTTDIRGFQIPRRLFKY